MRVVSGIPRAATPQDGTGGRSHVARDRLCQDPAEQRELTVVQEFVIKPCDGLPGSSFDRILRPAFRLRASKTPSASKYAPRTQQWHGPRASRVLPRNKHTPRSNVLRGARRRASPRKRNTLPVSTPRRDIALLANTIANPHSDGTPHRSRQHFAKSVLIRRTMTRPGNVSATVLVMEHARQLALRGAESALKSALLLRKVVHRRIQKVIINLSERLDNNPVPVAG